VRLILDGMTEHTKPDEPEVPIAEDLEVPAEEGEQVKGGRTPIDVVKTPTPGGPVPVPYPNVSDR
jgi:hypothetical protein